jgi:hypothetical protein
MVINPEDSVCLTRTANEHHSRQLNNAGLRPSGYHGHKHFWGTLVVCNSTKKHNMQKMLYSQRKREN